MKQQDPRTRDGWQPVYEPVPIDAALPAAVCDRTLTVAHKLGFEDSPVYNEQGVGSIDDPSHRSSQSVWVQPEHDRDLYRRIQRLFEDVNSKRYRFSIYGMAPIQIIRYSEGGFFAEHFDLGLEDAAKRKISLLVQLSDAGDYEGGDVILAGRMTIPKARGAGCAFPSWVSHRVDRVRSGVRYSLAAWAYGSYFL